MTGNKLVKIVDRGGWGTKDNADNTERDRCSDRMKRVRKVVTRQVRAFLKKDLQKNLENDNWY